MAQTSAKPTDFNRALGDAKKQAGDVADAVTDAAQDVYGQARESAADSGEGGAAAFFCPPPEAQLPAPRITAAASPTRVQLLPFVRVRYRNIGDRLNPVSHQ